MRKLILSLAAVAVTVAAGMFTPSTAGATVVAPSAMQPGIVDTNMVDNVRWVRVCHHHWRSSNTHCRGEWRPGHHHHHHHHHGHHHHRHNHR